LYAIFGIYLDCWFAIFLILINGIFWSISVSTTMPISVIPSIFRDRWRLGRQRSTGGDGSICRGWKAFRYLGRCCNGGLTKGT
jgi:hypothetical protein